MKLIDIVESPYLRNPGEFTVGDTVDVHVKIIEGSKERVQIFTGVVIARRGRGTGASFTVRRIVAGEGAERSFPICSPRVDKVVVKKRGKVRRSKLYYLRDRVGRGTRLKEIMTQSEQKPQAPAEEAVAAK